MNNKINRVKVSIILSVYNTEKYLKKCLNSLVDQTLDSIEIIAVNNGSTDSSGSILNSYQEHHPEKFQVITIKENTGDPAEPWNIGINKAVGEYIGIVDSDDWCDISMFDVLYNAAKEYDADIALCDHYEVLGKNSMIRSKFNANSGPLAMEDFILNPHMAPWGKIVRRDVYVKNNLKYKSQIHCDTGLNLIMYSFVEKVTYIDEAFYYYNRLNPESETNTKKRMRQASIVDTLDHILVHYNKKWESEIVFDVVRFLYWFCFTEYFFHQDIFIPFILKYKEKILKNKYLRANRDGLRIVFDYLKKDMVPKQIVYSSFGKAELTEIEKECIKSWRKYTADYEIIELNEENCRLIENPCVLQIYNKGDIERVSRYYLFKYLYNNGGIALDTHMMMNGPIGELRMHNLTVGYDSVNTIGDKVIAAKPHNQIIKRICEDILCQDEFPTRYVEDDNVDREVFDNEKVHQSIVEKTIQDCIEEQGGRLTNQNTILSGDFLILSSDRLYYNINHINLFYQVYPEIYQLCESPFVALHANAIKSYTNYINQLEAQCQVLGRELTKITNSRSWRYLEPVRTLIRFFRSVKGKLKLYFTEK